MTKEEAFAFLDRMARGIAAMYGSQCETVVHEISGRKIVNAAIYNGHVSGRTVGSTLSIYGRDTSENNGKEAAGYLESDHVNQLVITQGGKTIKSSTFQMKSEDYHYALGINMDITVLNQMRQVLEQMTTDEGTLQASISGANQSGLEDMFESCSEVFHRPLLQLQKTDRVALVGMLKEKGFFQIQKSVPYAAERLGVTKYTIYNYLNELGGI